MTNSYRRVIATAMLCMVVAGCDILNDAINDAIPPIGVSDGFLGLNGEAGVELEGVFMDEGGTGAGKSMDLTSAVFGVEIFFEDLSAGDVTSVRSAATSLTLRSVRLNRGTASSLPASITATNLIPKLILLDDEDFLLGRYLTLQNWSYQGSVVLSRPDNCAATATSCLYPVPETVIANLSLNESDATTAIRIVSSAPSQNVLRGRISVNFSNPRAELEGMSVTARFAEINTKITPRLAEASQ